MPLVEQNLSKSEINDLVGKIMGKRSSELMAQILTMAVQNLNPMDRDAMVRYMKEAMVGTFFERWLKMGGWMSSSSFAADADAPPKEGGHSCSGCAVHGSMLSEDNQKVSATAQTAAASVEEAHQSAAAEFCHNCEKPENVFYPTSSCALKTAGSGEVEPPAAGGEGSAAAMAANEAMSGAKTYTSATELEKLIRAIGTNPNLDTKQKNLTIQGLRDSVWKSNCRLSKRKRDDATDEYANGANGSDGHGAAFGTVAIGKLPVQQIAGGSVPLFASHVAAPAGQIVLVNGEAPSVNAMGQSAHPPEAQHMSYPAAPASAAIATPRRRDTPPSAYFKKGSDGRVKLVWSSDPHETNVRHSCDDGPVPLFSASELAPTYHDGGINHVLGCPHYARSCKLRHPSSGRLYTCRLCCEQEREMPMRETDSPLDRYEVTEVMCMRCGALQPANDKCVNPKCDSRGKSFSKYSCGICNFYDDSPHKSIYHCPFCNVCRAGLGLGIDYRHCMRCNACVSLKDEHNCIPQRLQGNCPICHEDMFDSTEPLRGLKCGHVMHLSCYTMYRRGQNYTCPLCKRSADDMTEYFSLLDSAIRMQPMPPAYAATTSDTYCQDCGKTGNVAYHFVGLKCNHCKSFNTRELQRVDANITSNSNYWQGYS